MSRSTRSTTVGLATVAVASMVTLAAPSAHAADDRGCGQPAVPAVTRTVVVDPVFGDVPAVTHLEWLWSRDVDVVEHEFVRVLKAASTETDWSRTVPGPVEHLFSKVVVDSPAVTAVPAVPATGHDETYEITPAVTELLVEYVHQVTGKTRWESDDWGAQNGQGNGWVKTGNTRLDVVKPAVTGTRWVVDTPAVPGTPAKDAVTHVETLWAVTDPGAPWTGPTDERPGPSSVENTTTDGSTPAGSGWVAGATRVIDAVTENGWAEVVPDGTTPTGDTRVARTDHQVTPATSAGAPAGAGWTQVAGSAVTITDSPATRILLVPGSTTVVEDSPALPATAPCVEPPTPDPAPPAEAPQAAPAADVSPAATSLPNTGGVPWWMAPAGLVSVLVGAGVVRRSRTQI